MPPEENARPEGKVKIRNNTRRGLLVKVPGQALHLQPGQTAEVQDAYLNTDELSALVRSGAVVPVFAAPPAPVVAPVVLTGGAETSDDAAPDRRPRRPR